MLITYNLRLEIPASPRFPDVVRDVLKAVKFNHP